MKLCRLTAVMTATLALALIERAAADPERQHGEREAKFERHEIDEAITSAQAKADTWSRALDQALTDTKQDGKKREQVIRQQMTDLLNALARLRKSFDEDGAWEDQKADVRTAYSIWRSLDPDLRKHWLSKTRDEFEHLHHELRELARIYEVDAPAR